MTHTEQDIRAAMQIVRMPDARTARAFERQLRAENPGAWFVVAAKRQATTADADAQS